MIGRHLDRHAPGEDDQVGLPRRGAEGLEAEARDVHARAGGVELLHRAAGEAEGEREERVRARPRDGRVERRRDNTFFDVAFELLALEVGRLVGAFQLGAAQQLVGVQLAHPQLRRVDAALPSALPFHFHSSAPRRHTYTKATNSSTMKTIVSTSA